MHKAKSCAAMKEYKTKHRIKNNTVKKKKHPRKTQKQLNKPLTKFYLLINESFQENQIHWKVGKCKNMVIYNTCRVSDHLK